MHRFHPDVDDGDPPRDWDVFLWDDCARCEAHAARPWDALDDVRLQALLAIADESIRSSTVVPKQKTEAMWRAALNVARDVRQAKALLARVKSLTEGESDG